MYAGTYTWTGGANDGGRWTTPQNWTPNGYPQTTSDIAQFNSSATVTINTGSSTVVGCIKLAANIGTVTLNGTEGSSLDTTKTAAIDSNGFVVPAGSKLVVNLPVSMDARIDKWQAGEVEFTAAVTTTASSNPFVLDNGKTTLSGSAAFSAANGDIGIGNYTANDTATLELKDSASLTAKNINTGINAASNAAVGHIIQNGEGSSVNVTGGISLSHKSGHAKPSVYELNAGALVVGGTLTIGTDGLAQYIQTGGTSTVSEVSLKNQSGVALRGGVMKSGKAPSISSGSTFEIANATLALTNAALTSWNWSAYDVGPDATVAIVGTSSLSIPRDSSSSTFDIGLEIGEGKTVEIASGATIYAPRFSTNAWNVTLNNGAVLKLADSSSRILTPLNLTVNGTGKILFNNHRGALVTHRLVVDGVEKGKGFYWKPNNSFVDGGQDCDALVVPHIWTGAGDGTSWNDPSNWDANTVPNGNAVAADISRASSITLNDNISLGCLVAMPAGASRKVTVTGSGKISLHANKNYCCGIIIPKDCELVLDVGLERSSNDTLGMSGGGRLTLTKTVPSTGTGAGALLAFDGTLALRGVQTLVPYTGSSYNFLTYFSYESRDSELLIDEGTTISTARFTASNAGYSPLSRVRQIGGSVTFDNNGSYCCYIQTFNKDCESANTYYLEGGTLTVNGMILLGRSNLTSNKSTPRYPGGSFEMSGGTLNVNGFAAGFNQNYVRLYGGDVYLNGDCSALFDNPEVIAGTNRNDFTFYFGGVTIHPSGGAARKLSSGNMYLTGKNGDTVFDVSQQDFTISSGNTVSGPGGIVVTGVSERSVISDSSFTFTGAITVKSGNITCHYYAPLNGPSALIVENASSVATFGRSTSKDLEKVVLAASSCLYVSANETFRTKRLVVNGQDVQPGSYTGDYGLGTVVVTGSTPASWVDGGVGDLSWFADGTTTTVGAATTLSSLTYDPLTAGQTNTLAGDAALTFADGANIYVARGDTLVIENPVTLGGKVTKTGWGEVVFNGVVSGVATPTESSDATDPRWLTVVEGGATFDDAVQGVRLVTCGSIDAGEPPVITLKENCTVSNYGIVLTAWSENSLACCGETHQEGATVDYSTTIFTNLVFYNKGSPDMHALTKPNLGGYGRYVLDSGTFTANNSLNLTFVLDSGTLGSFEFLQNGGTLAIQHNFTFARNYIPTFTYTLNGGSFVIGGNVGGVFKPSCNVLNLNGGTYVVNASHSLVREVFALNIGGEVAFDVSSGKTLSIANDAMGGVSIVKTGAGTLALDGVLDVTGLDVQAGMVTLKDKILPALDGTAGLSIAKTGATLNLDYEGEAAFKTLKIGEQERGAGVYSATKGATVVSSRLAGDGELRILEGFGPGSMVIVF